MAIEVKRFGIIDEARYSIANAAQISAEKHAAEMRQREEREKAEGIMEILDYPQGALKEDPIIIPGNEGQPLVTVTLKGALDKRGVGRFEINVDGYGAQLRVVKPFNHRDPIHWVVNGGIPAEPLVEAQRWQGLMDVVKPLRFQPARAVRAPLSQSR